MQRLQRAEHDVAAKLLSAPPCALQSSVPGRIPTRMAAAAPFEATRRANLLPYASLAHSSCNMSVALATAHMNLNDCKSLRWSCYTTATLSCCSSFQSPTAKLVP